MLLLLFLINLLTSIFLEMFSILLLLNFTESCLWSRLSGLWLRFRLSGGWSRLSGLWLRFRLSGGWLRLSGLWLSLSWLFDLFFILFKLSREKLFWILFSKEFDL